MSDGIPGYEAATEKPPRGNGSDLQAVVRRTLQSIRYLLGWIFVRPRRWLFWKMVANTYPRWLPEKKEWDDRIWWPNIHWWFLYKTVFQFFKWLHYDAWRPLCKWGPRFLEHKPWYASAIQRIGSTTSGFAISGGECFHCGSKDGDQGDLADDETGETFRLEGSGSFASMDGTDHRFWGTTICPKCGYEAYYEDGSL